MHWQHPAKGIEELQTQNVSATSRLKEAESRLEEVEERLRTRESELGRSRSEAAAQEKRDRGELDRLQTSLRDADLFLVEFRDALAASSQRIEELQTQNVSATEAVVSLRAENRKLREELKHFTREVQELSAVSQEAQSTRRSLQERIARLRERFEEAVRDKEAVVSLQAENRKLREELKRFTREVQELSAVSQEAQSTRQSLQERNRPPAGAVRRSRSRQGTGDRTTQGQPQDPAGKTAIGDQEEGCSRPSGEGAHIHRESSTG